MNMKSLKTSTAAVVLALVAATSSLAQEASIPKQKVNEQLRARLPQKIKEAGKLNSVVSGTLPPYEILTGTVVTGASAELARAVGELLGVEITHPAVNGMAPLLSGMSAGRYELAFGPSGDFKSRQVASDFVDWVQEEVVFGVLKGNPKKITSLEATCGNKIAVAAGGSAERVMKAQAEKCVAENKAPIEVQSFADQPQSILAVRSKRSDAFFTSQAILVYYIGQANGELELAGVGMGNGFEKLYQGVILPKDSELGPIVRDAIQVLMDNGTYAVIMKKWGLERNMLTKAGMNLGN